MQFFKKVLAAYKGGEDHVTLTADLIQDHEGANRVTMELTVFGPRGGKRTHWFMCMNPRELHAISDALRKAEQEVPAV
jgi:hypothetical protein